MQRRSSSARGGAAAAYGGDRLISVTEAAAVLGTDVAAVHRARRQGALPAAGGRWGRWLFRASDVAAFAASGGDAPTAVAGAGPIERMANAILREAIECGATDIHLEPGGEETRVRRRVDGTLEEATALPAHLHAPLIQRYRVMADAVGGGAALGSFMVEVSGQSWKIRAAFAATPRGGSVALRILDPGRVRGGLEGLGFSPEARQRLETAARTPGGGMIVIAGPIGNGVTTTAFALLQAVNTVERHAVVVASVCEYEVDGATHVLVDPNRGGSLTAALDGLRYQDVDLLLLNDVAGDAETVRSAIRMAASGRLVIVTVTARDRGDALQRLGELGLSVAMREQILRAVVVQRLARKICPRCKDAYPATAEQVRALLPHRPDVFSEGVSLTLFHGPGCAQCRDTGICSRTVIADVADGPETTPPAEALRDAAVIALLRGVISYEEFSRVAG